MQQIQQQFGASKAEDVDFERDANQGSLLVSDLDKSKQQPPTENKEKRFLLNELKQIKEQMYKRLLVFKARSAGKRLPTVTVEAGMFEITDNSNMLDILRKEIDHVFEMSQVLSSVVLRGDETMRTMEELKKLCASGNDDLSLDQLVKCLSDKFHNLQQDNQSLQTE